MPPTIAYKNGKFINQDELNLSVFDAGFIHGATVSDLCRTYSHKLFKLESHLRRFRRSCRLAGVSVEADNEELARVAERLVRENSQSIPSNDELILVMFATPGELGYFQGRENGPPTIGMHTYPLPVDRYAPLKRDGARLIISTKWRHPGQHELAVVKNRSRLVWWMAQKEVQQIHPTAQPLLLNDRGLLTETPTSNFLAVFDGKVSSPRKETILNGVALELVEEQCNSMGIPFEERDMSPDDLELADEAMITSTPFGVAPVSSIDSRHLRCPGEIFRLLEFDLRKLETHLHMIKQRKPK